MATLRLFEGTIEEMGVAIWWPWRASVHASRTLLSRSILTTGTLVQITALRGGGGLATIIPALEFENWVAGGDAQATCRARSSVAVRPPQLRANNIFVIVGEERWRSAPTWGSLTPRRWAAVCLSCAEVKNEDA